jgi:hypothetical protein
MVRVPLTKDLDEAGRRTAMVVVIIFNVALLPILANVVAVLSPSSSEVGRRKFQIALLVVAILASLLRWRLIVGIAIDILLVVAAVLALFWSPEPFAYLAYSHACRRRGAGIGLRTQPASGTQR